MRIRTRTAQAEPEPIRALRACARYLANAPVRGERLPGRLAVLERIAAALAWWDDLHDIDESFQAAADQARLEQIARDGLA